MTTKSRYDPERHHRQSIRKPEWDYSGPGRYFVTICSVNRELIFGDDVNGGVELSETGKIVEATWQDIADIHRYVTLDAWIVMPNHLHGILIVQPLGWSRETEMPAPPAGTQPRSVGAIIAGFKNVTTRRVNTLPDIGTSTIWQRGYHDRIIPDDDALDRARTYIHNNPANWLRDPDHPRHAHRDPQPSR